MVGDHTEKLTKAQEETGAKVYNESRPSFIVERVGIRHSLPRAAMQEGGDTVDFPDGYVRYDICPRADEYHNRNPLPPNIGLADLYEAGGEGIYI